MPYSSKQTFDITGETKQRIQYWVLKGLFQPADKGRGVGTSRGYSEGNLLEITVNSDSCPDFEQCRLYQAYFEAC